MKKRYMILLIIFVFFLTSCTNEKSTQKELIEDENIYQNDVVNSLKKIYIIILPAEDQAPKYSYTFAQLNEDIDSTDDTEVEVRVIFQEGNDTGPKVGYFGYGLTDANSVMKLRGQSARRAEQKSYKIKLNKAGGLWDGYKIINLNKHPYDSLRIRNKLSFDYLKSVSDITSLRTQFVHLYIKDLSEGDYTQEYKDFGLFTQVENVDTDFLKNHGLDPKGSLYKVENFEFYRYPENIKITSDVDYQKKSFEEKLEIKANDDHTNLIRMLNDVNNEFISINDIIEKYFEKDNYITWMAVNILFDNIDTSSRNYFLYNPSDNNTWYFLPWDYDKGWGAYNFARGLWQEGVSNYWGVVLHRRFLKNEENLKELTQKIESLSKLFNEENTKILVDAYKPIATEFLSREPDNQNNTIDLEDVYTEIESLPKLIEENKKKYYQSIERPMPVFMASPTKLGDNYIFQWSDSYDLQGDFVEYSIDISRTPSFEIILYHEDRIRDVEHIVTNLPLGKYYWRLTIKDSKGNIQIPFDIYIDKDMRYHFGVQEFFVF
ncbi:MAG: CotH kinase family protein [Halanaerobiales bacterium]|nr:CotH kinase family protein [Halanaerobiales bacterium]